MRETKNTAEEELKQALEDRTAYHKHCFPAKEQAIDMLAPHLCLMGLMEIFRNVYEENELEEWTNKKEAWLKTVMENPILTEGIGNHEDRRYIICIHYLKVSRDIAWKAAKAKLGGGAK